MEPYIGVFPGDVEQIRQVRNQVRGYLDGCPVADDVILIVSELAANAARHSNSRDGTFTVQVERWDNWVHVAVIDAGGRWIQRHQDDYPHGLAIVIAIAGRLGVLDYLETGERVIFATVSF